jgi:arylsulfatase A-like enzyme
MLKRIFLIFLFSEGVVFAQNPAKVRPNIIIIMADDMGNSDLGCTGSEIETPNLDKMAKNRVLFTNFYNTSRYCLSRASLLSGQYQWDAGLGGMDSDGGTPQYQGYINDESVIIAEALKLNGYQTFMSGKWHLGSKERSMWPDNRGFDQFYGSPKGGGLYYAPSKFYDRPVYWNGEKVETDSTWYSTDAFTDSAIKYIKEDKEENKPFFMYLAYIAPHFPLQAKSEDISKYLNKYNVGYDAIRRDRFEKQKRLGIISKTLPLSKSKVPEWNLVENKEEEALKMAVYAAMVDCMDQNIGRLMSTLKQEGLKENTIVIFLSDNGASEVGWNKTPEVEIGTRFSNASYGKWYNVSNTPYRMHKATEHEGGIITPLIVHWPNGIKKKGQLIKKPAHITDLMPTCLELTNTNYPDFYKNKKLDPLDGLSILPIINNGEKNKNREFFWEHFGNRAIRKGNWKLVAFKKKPWELYNMEIDPYELNNVISSNSEKARELQLKYEKWAIEHGVR